MFETNERLQTRRREEWKKLEREKEIDIESERDNESFLRSFEFSELMSYPLILRGTEPQKRTLGKKW